jgi:hypothetical protein
MRGGCARRLWLRCLRSCVCPRHGLTASTAARLRPVPPPRRPRTLRLPSFNPCGISPIGPRTRAGPVCNSEAGLRGTQGSVRRPAIQRLGFIPPIQVRPIRGLVTLLRRMGLPVVLLTSIPERRRRATWATGSISTGVFRSRNRSGCCAATPASGASTWQTSSG